MANKEEGVSKEALLEIVDLRKGIIDILRIVTMCLKQDELTSEEKVRLFEVKEFLTRLEQLKDPMLGLLHCFAKIAEALDPEKIEKLLLILERPETREE